MDIFMDIHIHGKPVYLAPLFGYEASNVKRTDGRSGDFILWPMLCALDWTDNDETRRRQTRFAQEMRWQPPWQQGTC